MGPVTEEESPRKMETKATDQVTKPKRMRLKSIVNISEFEVAASQRLSPRALACKFFLVEILYSKGPRLKVILQSSRLVPMMNTRLNGTARVGSRSVFDLESYDLSKELIFLHPYWVLSSPLPSSFVPLAVESLLIPKERF